MNGWWIAAAVGAMAGWSFLLGRLCYRRGFSAGHAKGVDDAGRLAFGRR